MRVCNHCGSDIPNIVYSCIQCGKAPYETNLETVPMTTITPELRAEARRRLKEWEDHGTSFSEVLAQALAEPAWQPPVDPDLIEARECAALVAAKLGLYHLAEQFRDAQGDATMEVQSALIAIKRRQP